jgi:hypothetical protein|tara:strand:+ start:45 stop:275 length:231 start_codon:yes stop_codon:yes gene_type:complete
VDNMGNALNTLRDIVGQLTGILVALVGLGIVAGVVIGTDVAFVPDVLTRVMDTVSMLGASGLVGLIVLAVLLELYR